MDELYDKLKNPWVIFGFGAQLLFFMRFLVQWIASEKAGRSVVPVAFWYFSLGGACGLLVYAVQQRDPVFILGQSLGFVIYTRNLVLIQREKLAATAAVPTQAQAGTEELAYLEDTPAEEASQPRARTR